MATQDGQLIPKADEWMDNNFNVMLIGLHGVGKTQVVLDKCREKGLKLKYFSCSTLDPFTDLVGVPFARPADENSDEEYLKMVRQREIDEAEIIFMDEFNRADPKVHNALLEIIQFHSLNGEALPNLRMVWAAMNPPGGDYDVEELDPALIDRFDVFEDVAARPSAQYMASKGIRLPIAQAIIAWWREQNKQKRNRRELITPRRLEKIGHVYEQTGDFKNAIPLWFKTDIGKLRMMLQEAEAKAEAEGLTTEGGTAQTGPSRRFNYTDRYIADNEVEVAEYLGDNEGDLETNQAVASILKSRHAQKLVNVYGAVANNLTSSVLEALIANMADQKLKHLVQACKDADAMMKPRIEKLTKVASDELENR